MSCLHCGNSLAHRTKGSGRQRTKYCSTKCKNRAGSARQYKRWRAKNLKKPRPTVKAQDLYWQRDQIIRTNEILKRGKCATHLELFGHELLVTDHNKAIFQFDHLDRQAKVGIVSRMIGRHSDPAILIREMAKCQLVCANCHHMKTLQKQDYLPIQRRSVAEHLQLELH